MPAGKARTKSRSAQVSQACRPHSAGLKKGDLLLKVNGVPIHSRFTLPEVIRKSDGKPVTIEYSARRACITR